MNLRHVVTVMRPSEATDSRGQTQGNPETIISEWPCSIETLNGREVVQARTVFATVTHRVTDLYLDPTKRLKAKDYLMLNGRRLNIEFPNDTQQNGVRWEALCNEQV